MAKAKTNTADVKTLNIGKTLRKGTLAYLGLYGTAYARAKTRFDQVKASTDGLYGTLVARGEVIEAKAAQTFKTTRETATTKAAATYAAGSEKIRSVMPVASNDRVAELEAEVKALQVKIAAAAKKSSAKAVKKAAAPTMKTEKSKKAA